MNRILYIALITFFITSCSSYNEEELYPCKEEAELTYSKNIGQLIEQSCAVAGCHVTGTGRNVYDSYSSFKKDVDNGTVLAKVITNKSMPPSGFSDCNYDKMKQWLDEGAKE